MSQHDHMESAHSETAETPAGGFLNCRYIKSQIFKVGSSLT